MGCCQSRNRDIINYDINNMSREISYTNNIYNTNELSLISNFMYDEEFFYRYNLLRCKQQFRKYFILPGNIINYTEVPNDETCSICLDYYIKDIEINRLPCHHIFHKKCLIDWFIINKSCPICRAYFC